MSTRVRIMVIVTVLFLAAAGYNFPAFAAHPGAVTLVDKDGVSVAGTTNPYSPKKTCASVLCHADIKATNGVTDIYEDSVDFSTKDHGLGSPSYEDPYQVPYPKHGVSAGYHFQQGRNISYGDPQRDFYKLAGFTSSAGMFGKY